MHMESHEEIKTLKAILRRYEKQLDTLNQQKDNDKQILEIRNLRNEVASLKKKSKAVSIERDQFERDLIKQAKIISSLQDTLNDYKLRENVVVNQERLATEKQNLDALEKKYKLEIKNLKHESNILRTQVHVHDETIKALKAQAEDLSTRIKEKDRIIASFAIWRKSIVYTKNKHIDDKERIQSIKSALPVPVLSLINHLSDQSSAVRVKITDLSKLDKMLKTLKVKDGYKDDEAKHLEERDVFVCLESKNGDIKMEIPATKDGEYEFEMNDLNIGQRYQLECFLKDKASGVSGNRTLIDVVSDLLPSAPNPTINYDASVDGIKFILMKTKQTVKSFNIYLLDEKTSTNNLIQTIFATTEKQEFLYNSRQNGFHVFQVSQVNDIGEGRLSNPITVNIQYPTKPELETIYRDKSGDISMKLLCKPSDTSRIHLECVNNGSYNAIVDCETEQVLHKLKKFFDSLTFKIRAESHGGQYSEYTKVTVSVSEIASYPSKPEYMIKSSTSLLVFPSKKDDLSRLTAIQVRYKINTTTILETTPSSALTGVVLTDLPCDCVQVAIKYAVGRMWSQWSDYESISLASAIELPQSTPNVVMPHKQRNNIFSNNGEERRSGTLNRKSRMNLKASSNALSKTKGNSGTVKGRNLSHSHSLQNSQDIHQKKSKNK